MHSNTHSEADFCEIFYKSHDDKLFKQSEIKKIIPLSDGWFERNRVYGGGIKFIKIGRSVFYRKSDVMDFLKSHKSWESTSQCELIHQGDNKHGV